MCIGLYAGPRVRAENHIGLGDGVDGGGPRRQGWGIHVDGRGVESGGGGPKGGAGSLLREQFPFSQPISKIPWPQVFTAFDAPTEGLS